MKMVILVMMTTMMMMMMIGEGDLYVTIIILIHIHTLKVILDYCCHVLLMASFKISNRCG